MSIDPVTTDANSGGGFNRYAYANNSPYKYVDPDGRFPFLLPLIPYIVGGGTVAVVGHYVLPGRQGREETGRAVGNAIFNSGAGDKGSADALKSDNNKAPVPGASGGEKTNTGTRIWDKPGDFGVANQDFDNKNPANVEDKRNGVRVGTLEDGKRIIVRPGSTDGRPTIEVQRPDGKRSEDKVRYGDKE
ncbi:RHS repeat-associated core domain-containing protein [Massilia sp. GCM10023247]|uniref:hypothetical protein n=1 Tax=Massilia sp. GCM10023247 TaxID=3252643 RepID=UPI00360E2A9F